MEGTGQLKPENAKLFLHCYKGLQLSIAYNYSWKLYCHISQSTKEIKTLFGWAERVTHEVATISNIFYLHKTVFSKCIGARKWLLLPLAMIIVEVFNWLYNTCLKK